MSADRPTPEERPDDALVIIECTIPPELTIAEWRCRLRTSAPRRFQRFRSVGRAWGA
jgi:hypothetical protein